MTATAAATDAAYEQLVTRLEEQLEANERLAAENAELRAYVVEKQVAAFRETAAWLRGGVDDHAGMEIGMEISGPTGCSCTDRCRRAGERAFLEAARIWEHRGKEDAS